MVLFRGCSEAVKSEKSGAFNLTKLVSVLVGNITDFFINPVKYEV